MKIAPPVARALRLSVFEGGAFAVYWNVVAGVIMNGLLLALGAGPVALAVLNALPLLSQVFGVLAARVIQARDVRKPFAIAAEGASRGVWLLVPLLLLLPEDGARVWFVLAVAALSHAAHAAGVVSWLSWVSDLVPEEIRGVYFGVRTAVAGLIGVAGLTAATAVADAVRDARGAGPEYLRVLLVLVAVALVFAGVSWVMLLYQPVRRMRRLAATGWAAIRDSLATRNGRRIALTWTTFAFSTGITAGIYMPFFLDRLAISLTGLAVYSWIALGVSTAMTPVLGRFSDRFGHRNLLLLAWLGVFWQPLLSVFTPNDAPHVLGLLPATILVDAVAGGCFWPAMGLAQTNLVIAQAKSEERAGLFAALTAMAGVAGFVAALGGGALAEAIGTRHTFTVAGIPLDDLRLPLLVGAGLRFATGLTILLIREPPRTRGPVPAGQAFATVWRLLSGKPVRPITR